MFGYEERDERSGLTDYLYEEMSAEALMLYALLEFHDYNRAEDFYCSRRNRILKTAESPGEKEGK